MGEQDWYLFHVVLRLCFCFISMEKLNIFGNKKVADCLCVSLQFRNFAQTKTTITNL